MAETPRLKNATLLLFGRALRTSFAERAAYRGDFLLSFLVSFLLELVAPLVTLLIYRSGTSFAGWTMEEALLIQAVFLLSRGIAFPLFFGMVWVVFEQAREGTFEITLLKPRSPLLLTMLRGLDIEGVSRMLGGILLVILAVRGLPAPGLTGWLCFALFLFLSVLILFGFALMLAASLFVWIGNGRVIELLEAVLVFSRYPGTIFGKPLQWFFALGLPLSMIALFPAEALLGRFSLPMFLAIPAALGFLGLGWLFWNRMIRRYAGGGG
jgi:ABC-2 type transport system permease protein